MNWLVGVVGPEQLEARFREFGSVFIGEDENPADIVSSVAVGARRSNLKGSQLRFRTSVRTMSGRASEVGGHARTEPY